MANLILIEKETGIIHQIIRDCVKDGNNYYGKGIKLLGIKDRHFDFKWTNEDITATKYDENGNPTEWSKELSQISDLPLYNNTMVANRNDIDSVTKKRIQERYSAEDELKLHRQMLSGITVGWTEYVTFVDTVVEEGKQFKNTNFPEVIE